MIQLESARADYFTALAELRRWSGGELTGITVPAAMNSEEFMHE